MWALRGDGKPTEQDVLEKKAPGDRQLGTNGRAALKGLTLDGERHEDPQLF